MPTFVQITDTDNDVLQTLPLGDISDVTTFSFRVWNNLPQAAGIRTLDDLVLHIYYPPLQGIATLINNDVIQIRCTYSGERSQAVNSSFQSFPITDKNYDRLEPYTYNEYEIRIDFSTLTAEQKQTIDLVNMQFNIVAKYVREYPPFSVPKLYQILSDTSIRQGSPSITITSDTLIDVLLSITILSDSVIRREAMDEITMYSDSKIRTPFIIEPLSDSRILVSSTIDVLSDIRIVSVLGSEISVLSDSIVRIVDNEIVITGLSRVKNTDSVEYLSDSRIKVVGVIPDRLLIESNTKIV